MTKILLLALAALALTTGTVRAEPLDLKPPAKAAAPSLNLSRPAINEADRKLMEMRAQGVAQTSVERAVGGGGSAAFGFLCGLYPGQNLGGVHAARGYDPQGKFMGAKLAFAF